MKFRFAVAIALLFFGLAAFSPNPALSQTRLGLHVTQEELTVWRQRASSGPYRTGGDVSANSPGDWTRINNNANSFRSNPNNERWAGQTAGSCWSYLSNPPALPSRHWGERLRDTAFRFLLMGDTADRDAVLNELLAQAATTGTNWADSTRWNTSNNCAAGDAWSWQITQWLTKLLYAYDYIRPGISAANKTTLDNWFLSAAHLWDDNVRKVLEIRFPQRDSDNYTNQGYTQCLGALLTHFGGFTHCDFHEGWNNRNGNHIRFSGLVGIMLNNSTLKTRAKRYVTEWVRFANFADSTNSQMHRAIQDNRAGAGFDYTGLMMGTMVTLADAFARNGDQSVYNFSTSLGDNVGLTPAGGPKSVLSVIKRYLDYVDGAVLRYGTINPANNGNPSFKIDSIDEVRNEFKIEDSYVAPLNNFFQDARVKSIYMRNAPGAPSYPSNISGSGFCVWCGDWGTLPGVLFMFGQMEGKVTPYSGTTTTAPSPAPSASSSVVTVDSTYPEYAIAPIDDGMIDAKGGTATTWASGDSPTADHWVNIAFPSAQNLNTATIHWAYNPLQQKYMTSQKVFVQIWSGSSYVTVATVTHPGNDLSSSTVFFPEVTTDRLRFYQPANQGNPTYTTVMWITEVDYDYVSASPSSPTGLHLTSTP